MAMIEHDPLRCLRCSSIGIGIWSILYCLIHLGLLGWQIQVVKQWQWYWENRELPATGAQTIFLWPFSIDQYQARFPGLYAIYTETPERRRVNAMYAIVLICVGLTIVHLPVSAAMLYGCVKRLHNWVLPWFFTSAPLILLCTAYSVLWWSGDIFNEQLTFSVLEFTMSLAVNGICFVVVFLYYQRLRGKLVSERSGGGNGGRIRQEFRGGRMAAANQQRQSLRQTMESEGQMPPPPWVESLSDKAPPAIERKLRRKERKEWQMQQKLASNKATAQKQTRAKQLAAERRRMAAYPQQRWPTAVASQQMQRNRAI